MGLGAIGSRVARVGAAFGMEVVAWSPRMTPERAAAENAKAVSLDELLSTSKIVSMHLVAGPGTKGLNQRRSIIANASRFNLGKHLALCPHQYERPTKSIGRR
jgi:phosphoglycerate dehydrogenase-like enzyme